MAGDRTEKPTVRRLRDARKKGQSARSADLARVASLGAAVVALGWLGSGIMAALEGMLGEGMRRVGTFAVRNVAAEDLHGMVVVALGWVGRISGPVAAAAVAGAVAVNVAQNGWMFAPAAMRFDLTRLNPVTGLKRLGFSQAGLMSLKTLVAVVAACAVGWLAVTRELEAAPLLGTIPPAAAGMAAWGSIDRLLKQTVLALGAVALLDYALQRWQFTRSLRMTKQEVRDDYKLTEGNPAVKGRIRRIQREMARRRMLSAVKKATVVITNPTEYAVALEYRRAEMAAPRVVAKGRNLLAARIKKIAREHGVPTVENVPLAQALYRTAEVGDTIPAELYEAVAEVLAYLIRAEQLTL